MDYLMNEEVIAQAHEQVTDIVFYSNIKLVNKILKKYPNRNVYFMNGPIGIGTNGPLEAKTLVGEWIFSDIITYDDVVDSLGEIIDYCNGDDIYLYCCSVIFTSNSAPRVKYRFAQEPNQ